MSTGVSVMPRASFARVLPVQGAMTMMSNIFLGPMGSACTTVVMLPLWQMPSTAARNSDALKKRVSHSRAAGDSTG